MPYSNIEDRRAADRRRYVETRAEHNAASLAYYRLHRADLMAAMNVYDAANRARRAWRGATSRFGEEVDFATFVAVWSGRCFGCGKEPACGVDHIVPKARKGRNIESNLQPACLSCNHRKRAA